MQGVVGCFVSLNLVTHLVWPHQPENPLGRPRARWICLRRSPPLFPLFFFKHPLKALMLEASTTRWSSWFRLLITLFQKIQKSVHRNFTSFQCPLIPLVLSARVKTHSYPFNCKFTKESSRKKILKSVKNRQNYGHESVARFFGQFDFEPGYPAVKISILGNYSMVFVYIWNLLQFKWYFCYR